MKSEILSGTELMNLKQEPDNYLIDGMLWEHQHIMILAREKVGKSIFSLQMACALSCGEAFLGEYEIPEAMKVLYVQTESTRHETIERLKSMTQGNGVDWVEDNFFLLHTASLVLDKQLGLESLVEQITHRGINPRVIFIDPLYMSMEGGLTDDLSARACSKNMRKLGEHFNCAIVVVHHEHRGKRDKNSKVLEEGDDSIMGSFVWKAFPNHIIRLQVRQDKIRLLTCSTQRSSRVIQDMQLLLRDNPLGYEIANTPDHAPYIDQVYNHIEQQGQKSAQQIQQELNLSMSAVRKSLSYLSGHRVSKIFKVNPGRRPTYYGIKEKPE